jgi:type II secretory pathway component PulL
MAKSLFIDIGEKEVSTYLFDFRGSKYEMKEIKKYPLSEKFDFSPDALPGDIENAYLSLPLSSLNFRVIDLPFSDKERIREILPFELDGMILGGSDRVVFDDIIVGTSDNKQQVLAVYTEKNNIKEVLDKLKAYRIDPVFITCLELRNRLSDFSLPKLLSPVLLNEKERIALSIEEMKKPAINLRRGEFVYTRDIDKTKKSLRVTAVLAILIMLVLSAGVLLKILSARSEIAFVKNDIRKNYQEIFPGEKNIMNELYQLKSRMKEMKGREDIFLGIYPLKLLLNLSQIDKQGIVFHEIAADKVNITMKGEAPSLSEVQKVKDKLESLFDEVTISDSKSSAQDRILFTITAKEKRV